MWLVKMFKNQGSLGTLGVDAQIIHYWEALLLLKTCRIAYFKSFPLLDIFFLKAFLYLRYTLPCLLAGHPVLWEPYNVEIVVSISLSKLCSASISRKRSLLKLMKTSHLASLTHAMGEVTHLALHAGEGSSLHIKIYPCHGLPPH